MAKENLYRDSPLRDSTHTAVNNMHARSIPQDLTSPFLRPRNGYTLRLIEDLRSITSQNVARQAKIVEDTCSNV